MQFNTVLKFGSLALNVAQDQQVQELFTMIHKGARRRGIVGAVPQGTGMPPAQVAKSVPAQGQNGSAANAHPIPFAPSQSQPVPTVPPQIGKYLNTNNAKKMLGWAGEITNLLIK